MLQQAGGDQVGGQQGNEKHESRDFGVFDDLGAKSRQIGNDRDGTGLFSIQGYASKKHQGVRRERRAVRAPGRHLELRSRRLSGDTRRTLCRSRRTAARPGCAVPSSMRPAYRPAVFGSLNTREAAALAPSVSASAESSLVVLARKLVAFVRGQAHAGHDQPQNARSENQQRQFAPYR